MVDDRYIDKRLKYRSSDFVKNYFADCRVSLVAMGMAGRGILARSGVTPPARSYLSETSSSSRCDFWFGCVYRGSGVRAKRRGGCLQIEVRALPRRGWIGRHSGGEDAEGRVVQYPAIIKAPDAELIAIVKSGKNKMPSFQGKLTDDQMKAAVAYIRTLQKQS